MTPNASSTLDREAAEAIAAEASALMKRGIALRASSAPASVSQAVACFEQARQLRQQLPIVEFPAFRYDLAACWLNIAESLVEVGTPDSIDQAVAAFDEGLALLGSLPLDSDPRYPRRLAIAHQNRALVLHAQQRDTSESVLAGFGCAITSLEHVSGADLPDRNYLLATILTNVANVQVADGSDEALAHARRSATLAVSLVNGTEAIDTDHAEAGIKARHSLCRALLQSRRFETAGTVEPVPADVHQTTDMVDEALSLARSWDERGVTRFRALAAELFRFGAFLYARYQPQFLDEFIAENVAPAKPSDFALSPEMKSAAADVATLVSSAQHITVRLAWPKEFVSESS